ncbi:nucleoredoxin-like [Mercenaria mercenaria]|uniref:nucleoredoxin-like n=1 Tax=Mercenaria mercenaria TaxID=6596 RepID=UPI001E1D3A89|nr:nucleoredoxin-like [Mercenaria mercenaria]
MARTLENLLGDHVIRTNCEKVAVNTLCGKDRVIGIYFSAEWCPPCKGFTPKLVEFYKKVHQKEEGSKFEIVFVSWDKDDTTFTEYFKTMPWLALPFGNEKKGKLCKKFRVQGIPKLVLIDGETGQTITRDGYCHLMEDENGAEFPWRRKKFGDIIKGKLLKEGTEVDALEELKGKIVGLYFSAHWCPPCRVFTPELVRTYEKLKADGKKFEVIFVSSDRSEDSFTSFANSMPWLALPFGDPRSQMLKNLYEVEGIPMLVMIDEQGGVITMDGRLALNEDVDGQEFPWYPKPINELTEGGAIQLNESACLVLFVEPEDEEVDRARDLLLQPATEEYNKGEHRDLFFFISADDDICDSVRHFANLPDQTPLLTILDFPEQKVYISEEKNITTELVCSFVKDYLLGTLPAKSCRHNNH